MDKNGKSQEQTELIIPRAKNLREAMRRAPEILRWQMEHYTKEEMAERLTTYKPGVPHRWFGRPVAPITKEELLAFWNGGPDIEPRYLDIPQEQGAEAEAEQTPNGQREERPYAEMAKNGLPKVRR